MGYNPARRMVWAAEVGELRGTTGVGHSPGPTWGPLPSSSSVCGLREGVQSSPRRQGPVQGSLPHILGLWPLNLDPAPLRLLSLCFLTHTTKSPSPTGAAGPNTAWAPFLLKDYLFLSEIQMLLGILYFYVPYLATLPFRGLPRVFLPGSPG